MLMTGSKLESTLRFYEKAGYNKTINSLYSVARELASEIGKQAAISDLQK